MNAGPTFMPGRTGDYTASAYAKALIPFGNGKTPDMAGTHAFQIGGEFLYWRRFSKGSLSGLDPNALAFSRLVCRNLHAY